MISINRIKNIFYLGRHGWKADDTGNWHSPDGKQHIGMLDLFAPPDVFVQRINSSMHNSAVTKG